MEFKTSIQPLIHTICTTPYEYCLRSGVKKRGVLVRVEEEGVFGEGVIEQSERDAEICIEQELHRLKTGVPEAAGWRALHMAEEMRRFSRENQSLQPLLQPLETLTNAILFAWDAASIARLHHEVSCFGWRRAKVKLHSLSMTELFLEEAPRYFPEMVWIVDYQECFSQVDEARIALRWLAESSLPILYAEDPCAYDLATWQLLQEEGIALAVDRHFLDCSLAELLPFVALYKPYLGGYTTFQQFLASGGVGAITCSMVHPVEQGYTLMKASVLQRNYPESILHVGCATHTLLKNPPMEQRFCIQDGILTYSFGRVETPSAD